MISFLIALVFLMAGGGKKGKRPRSPTPQSPAEVGSDYIPGEESDDESTDWENLPIESLARSTGKELAVIGKGKGKGKGKTKGKEISKEKEKITAKKKATVEEKGKKKAKENVKETRGRKKSIGIEIREPTYVRSSSASSTESSHDAPIDPQRLSLYSSKLCIGERNVGVKTLIKHVPNIEALFENGDLLEVCNFCEQTGYGLELIREFYLRAGFLEDSEGGPWSFKTKVRGVEMTITPDDVATVLEMVADPAGIDYLESGFDAVQDWRKVMDGVCVPDIPSNGIHVMSKDLKIEYRFLNFVVCYNIMPLVNTKIVRWDRMLYMYLLGHPDIVHSQNINLNVPFLIWKRMAKDIKTSCHGERLPFPLLIMRLLRMNEVDTECTSYEYSLGIISETTLAKSSSQLQSETRRTPPRSGAAGSSRPSTREEVSLSSVYREQQRLSGELGRLSTEQARLTTEVGKLRRMLKAIFDKLGCCSADLPPADSA